MKFAVGDLVIQIVQGQSKRKWIGLVVHVDKDANLPISVYFTKSFGFYHYGEHELDKLRIVM